MLVALSAQYFASASYFFGWHDGRRGFGGDQSMLIDCLGVFVPFQRPTDSLDKKICKHSL